MFEEIVGASAPLQNVIAQAKRVAQTDSTVLILGESGTGKELIAKAIHRASKRANQPFIRLNCAALPPALIASELFGHERGSFTGALARRIGRFEAAHMGTIFLDEIGDLPQETQLALLRVLQEREIERVGSNHPIAVDVRVLAATHSDLEAAVVAGRFRSDLFFRLNVFPIHVPALRERQEDVPLLARHFLSRYTPLANKRVSAVSHEALRLMTAYHWPGNIRELQNIMERAVVLADDDTAMVDPSWLLPCRGLHREPGNEERIRIEGALRESRGRVSGPRGAAVRLGLARQTLDSRIVSLGIDKFAFRPR